jgi:hypothetical protein
MKKPNPGESPGLGFLFRLVFLLFMAEACAAFLSFPPS